MRRMSCDTGEHVGEPGLRIDVVQLGRHDQRGHDRGAVGSAIGACEQPGFPPQRKATQGALGRIAVISRTLVEGT